MISNENLVKFFYWLPKSFFSVLSILYLSVFKGVYFRGFGNIEAFKNKNLILRISGKGYTIGKRVTIKADLHAERGAYIDDKCYLVSGPISIGKETNIMYKSEIVGPVSIGNYCAIARKVVFQAENHSIERASLQRGFYSKLFNEKLPSMKKRGIKIGNDVWIGTRVIILPGVKIGDGAIIGSGSIVTKDVEAYSISAGIPAKHKKWRFPDHIREQLINIKWWDWDEEKIKKNKKFFTTDLTKEKNLLKLIKD